MNKIATVLKQTLNESPPLMATRRHATMKTTNLVNDKLARVLVDDDQNKLATMFRSAAKINKQIKRHQEKEIQVQEQQSEFKNNFPRRKHCQLKLSDEEP